MKKNYIRMLLASTLISSMSFVAVGCSSSETASGQKATIPSVQVFKYGGETGSALMASGKIVPDQEVQLVTKIPGKVAAVQVSEGAVVKKGQELVQLEADDYTLQVNQAQSGVAASQAKLADVKAGARSEEIQALQAGVAQAKASVEQVQATIVQAKASLELAEKSYERTKSLFENGAVSQAEMDRVSVELEKARSGYTQAEAQQKSVMSQLAASEAKLHLAQSGPTSHTVEALQADVSRAQSNLDLAKNTLSNTSIVAPIDGIIVKRNIEPGEMAQPGVPLLSLVKMDTVQIEVSIPQERVNELKQGDVVKVSVAGLGNENIQGKVEFVSPVSDANNSTFPVTIKVDNGQGLLKAGMIAQVSFADVKQKDLEIPASTIVTKDEGTFLYVVEGDVLHQKAVKVEQKNKDTVTVLSGISNGDLIVLNPTDNLAEGIKVQVEKGV